MKPSHNNIQFITENYFMVKDNSLGVIVELNKYWISMILKAILLRLFLNTHTSLVWNRNMDIIIVLQTLIYVIMKIYPLITL